MHGDLEFMGKVPMVERAVVARINPGGRLLKQEMNQVMIREVCRG